MFRLGLALGCLVSGFSALGSAQNAEKKTTLRWYGQSFFQLETRSGQKIVFDPHAIPAFSSPRVAATVVLISHEHTDHNRLEMVEDPQSARVFRGISLSNDGRQTDWNRIDDKVLQTRIRSIPAFHDANGGIKRGKNSIWVVETDGLIFCHLGDLGHELTPEQIRAIGKIDVLMIPIGGIYTINGDAAKRVVEQLKPARFVIPMHYGVAGYDELSGPEEFLDGHKNVKRLESNELIIDAELKPNESPTIVLMSWKKAITAPTPAKKP